MTKYLPNNSVYGLATDIIPAKPSYGLTSPADQVKIDTIPNQFEEILFLTPQVTNESHII